ncbi:eCIS core domain-containing protein [Knoellia aerolata]|uniref:eCIS core domain-containing protein n=1 Tax=Knoellia aerolata TaxID=442954 RepID=UPI001FDFAF5E|nr:DUF4157 domain-containing protein [Knoellia aerolata]
MGATDATLLRAAAAGRPEVLGSQGLLRLQRIVGNDAVQRVAETEENPVSAVLGKGGGMPLGGPVREDMERRFGTDFADVRVHNGEDAHASAKAVNAHAYTVGSNIVFQRGTYDPSSPSGRTMLAHELTHVVQQRSGPVDGTATGAGIRVSDPGDRFEREAAANAERIVAMSTPTATAATVAATATAPAVQRLDATVQREGDDEEEVQRSVEPDRPLQRDEAEDEESG